MNWETAKTWLISIFLVLDALLGWQWIQSQNAMQGYVESNSDLLANTKTLLAQHGLALATDVPTDSPLLASLHGDLPKTTISELAKTAFDTPGSANVNTLTNTVFAKQGTLRLLDADTFIVNFTPPLHVKNGDLTPILARAWKAGNFAPDPTSNSSDQTVLLERYNGYPLFDMPLSIEVDKSMAMGYTESFVMNLTAVGANKPVISALDALDSLAVSVDKGNSNEDNRISKIDLGYLSKVQTNPFLLPAAPSTYWFPVWRVVTTSQVYYINAFSGEVDN